MKLREKKNMLLSYKDRREDWMMVVTSRERSKLLGLGRWAAVWGLDVHQLSPAKQGSNNNVITTLCNQKESGDVCISSLHVFRLPNI